MPEEPVDPRLEVALELVSAALAAKEPEDSEDDWLKLIREKSYEESAAFDALVAKLGTAGITVAVAIAGLTDADFWGWLVGAGFFFAVGLTASLLSLRLGADGLRAMGSGRGQDRAATWQFQFQIGKRKIEPVRILNWIAAIALPLAYVCLALHIVAATILTTGR